MSPFRRLLPAAALLLLSALTACSTVRNTAAFDPSVSIGVITREDGSGTRTAFTELFHITRENGLGQTVDDTVDTAAITNATSVMMLTISKDPYAIGYISLGSMNASVKALSIDGTAPTVETVQQGDYKIVRDFQVALPQEPSPQARDFLAFMLSADGQAVIKASGYIPVSGAEPYQGNAPAGKLVISGSSSIAPVMEKLKEAYIEKNPATTVEVQQSDSSTGLASAIDGTCDIGMSSRQLYPSELSQGLTPTVIAKDGIAVIVSPQNPLSGLSSRQVAAIFTGRAALWRDILTEKESSHAAIQRIVHACRILPDRLRFHCGRGFDSAVSLCKRPSGHPSDRS